MRACTFRGRGACAVTRRRAAAAIPSLPPATPAATLPPTATPALPCAPNAAIRRPRPRSAESDDAAIRRVVAIYARAIETKDIGLFRSVKPNPSGDEQRESEGFRAVASARGRDDRDRRVARA
jgi:hypothetical protein